MNNFEIVGNYTNYPAAVTWYGAMAWANFYGYDLPTEAEWEKAARGPDFDDQDEHCLYTWGNDRTTSKASFNGNYDRISNVGYCSGINIVGYCNGNQTPIGPDMPNGYGCYDMTGNADEWTRTLAKDRRYQNGSSYTTDYSFGIAGYPHQEDLDNERNQYWEHLWAVDKKVDSSGYAQFVIKHGEPIYVRYTSSDYIGGIGSCDNYSRIGFRVCRRYIPDNGGSGE